MLSKALDFQSPVTWPEAADHLAQRLRWAEGGTLNVEVVKLNGSLDPVAPRAAKLAVLINVAHDLVSHFLELVDVTAGQLVLSPTSQAGSQESWLLPRPGNTKSASVVLQRSQELWMRKTAEDALYAVLFAAHFCVRPIAFVAQEPAVDTPWKIFTLCTKCLREALAAGLDAEARACLDCQSGCDVRDQTQMYRCTVSHESESLASLVRCFERRGIFDCTAQIPRLPDFEPIKSFRGEVLSWDLAWRVMEGHLSGKEQCSWRPVLGQNPAYDFFPCQFNTWYRDSSGNRGWYDPVFKVVTLDGREVWRKRHYRVQPGKVPGSFMLSTEDNGISLKEHWRIADADEDLRWAVLHYVGAATSVGQSYGGSLLVSEDGGVPAGASSSRIREAFARCGVAPFELYSIGQDEVKNKCRGGSCGLPPLTDVPKMRQAS